MESAFFTNQSRVYYLDHLFYPALKSNNLNFFTASGDLEDDLVPAKTLAAIELDSGPLSETELQILESLTSITSSKLQSLLKEQEMRLELARSEVK